MTSNVAQSYPYTTETEADRAATIQRLVAQFGGLGETISEESEPLTYDEPDEPGKPNRSWVFVCPTHINGRLHVAGFARERHALYTICDEGGESYLR